MATTKHLLNQISFCFCDFRNKNHCQKLVELINHYMNDPMGDYIPSDCNHAQNLIDGLSNHPTAFVLFVKVNQEIAGLATCFINFSTFRAKAFLNLHDLIIHQKYRGKGIGKKLLEKVIAVAEKNDCCKVTLEVREDNLNAKKMYGEIGFKDSQPMMHFWTKQI